MSQENVELVRRAVEELNSGERSRARIRAVWHRDAEFLPRRSAIEGGYRGIEGFERWIADTDETFQTFQQHYELIDLGERVVAWGNVHVRARGSGIETDIQAGAVLEFRDGKIVRWEDFGSKEKALKAVGRAE